MDLYSTSLSMTYIAYSGTIATCTLLCDFICIRLRGKSSCMLKCIMLLPQATFLHCGASFRNPPYTLLQCNFIALTVVCNILNALSHCDVLSASLWTCSCSSIIVALHRTTGSLSLHYWHHLPWCFLDELVCCGQLRLVNSGTWIGLTHKLFDLFASSTLVTPIAPCFHFGCQRYSRSSHLSMWLDGKDIKLVMTNGHCSAPLQRLCCSDMHTCILETPLPWRVRASLCSYYMHFLHCICFLVGSFQCQHSVHLHFSDWIFWSLFIHVLPMLW
jgi:hypothetical protein